MNKEVFLIQEPESLLLHIRKIVKEELKQINLSQEKPQSDIDYIKIEEVASILKISKPTIYDWVNQGILTKYKINSRTYFSKQEILNLLDGQRILE